MSAAQREQLRLSLLRFLAENPTRFGYNAALLLQMARNEGRPELTRAEVEAELQYLTDKDLIVETDKVISPEQRAWRITAAGRDHHAQTKNE